MEFLDWNKTEIQNSDISNIAKDILLSEMDEILEINDPHIDINKYSFQNFKKRYNNEYKIVENIFGELVDSIMSNATTFDNNESPQYAATKDHITADSLLSFSQEFYHFLNDEALLKQYNYLLSTQFNHFRIQKDNEKNALLSVIRGRCLSSPNANDIYLSYYIRNSLYDYPEFIHETAHMIIRTLYKEKENYIFSYLQEFEAFFLQILACFFLSIKFNDPKLFDFLISELVTTTISLMQNFKSQSLLAKYLLKPRKKVIEKRFQDLKLPILDINDYYCWYPLKENDYIASFSMAFDLFMNNENDIEKALFTFHQILTAKNITPSYLLKHNIIFFRDNYNNLHEHLKKIKKYQKF